jgi:hypothetical protein
MEVEVNGEQGVCRCVHDEELSVGIQQTHITMHQGTAEDTDFPEVWDGREVHFK